MTPFDDFFNSEAYRRLIAQAAKDMLESEGWAAVQRTIAEDIFDKIDFSSLNLPMPELSPDLRDQLASMAAGQLQVQDDPDGVPRDISGTEATIMLAWQLAAADKQASGEVVALLAAAFYRLRNPDA